MTDVYEPVPPDPWAPVPPQLAPQVFPQQSPEVLPQEPVRTRTSPWHVLLAGASGAALVGALWVGLDLAGSGGYTDISSGTTVTVYNAAGTVLSQGALGTGRAAGTGNCVFTLARAERPRGREVLLGGGLTPRPDHGAA